MLLMNVAGEKRWRPLGRGMALAAVLLVCAIIGPLCAAERDSLSIGITQFPATLNPNIDVMAAKSYVLGLSLRPFTVYDADWKLACLLCTELPSISNGLAVPVDLPGGKKGIDLTYTIRPDAKWGDGVPVTTDDVLLHLRGRPKPAERGQQRRALSPHRRHRHKGRAYIYVACRQADLRLRGDPTISMLLPAHIERDAFADPAQYRLRTRYNTDPTNPGLYNGPYRVSEFVDRLAHSP